MTLTDLLAGLTQPDAYCIPIDAVEVVHTHISVVFLAGPFAYKIKKPVQFAFADFSSLEKRLHYCNEEVRLNRRLAPEIYLGVVPVVATAAGVRMEGQGEVVEWAVKMVRLPAEASLEQLLENEAVAAPQIEELGRRIASFHARAESGPRITEGARYARVAQQARDNLDQARSHVGITLHSVVAGRLRRLLEVSLERLEARIDQRALAGKARDTHGDLHLDHVYYFPGQVPPRDLVMIDCIEFNERFRHADPIADMAFLVMDLIFHARRDLARVFADAYFHASGDAEGRALVPFYTAYRAAVRAKVEGLECQEAEVPAEQKERARQKARAHWLLALAELEEPDSRPALVLVGGLPGSGKSTLARGLAERAGFEVIRSDVVRKELDPAGAREEVYAAAAVDRTYQECLRRAEELLFQGRRVVVDASFRSNQARLAFLDAARRWGVPAIFLVCQAEASLIRDRLAQRRGDASDADWSVYLRMAGLWEAPSPDVCPVYLEAGSEASQVVEAALRVLCGSGLRS